MATPVYQVSFSPEFEEKFNSLPVDIQAAAGKAIQKLLQGLHTSIRLHSYASVQPPYWVFDALSNHSYQISCRREENTFTLLDIGTHKQIEKRSRK